MLSGVLLGKPSKYLVPWAKAPPNTLEMGSHAKFEATLFKHLSARTVLWPEGKTCLEKAHADSIYLFAILFIYFFRSGCYWPPAFGQKCSEEKLWEDEMAHTVGQSGFGNTAIFLIFMLFMVHPGPTRPAVLSSQSQLGERSCTRCVWIWVCDLRHSCSEKRASGLH